MLCRVRKSSSEHYRSGECAPERWENTIRASVGKTLHTYTGHRVCVVKRRKSFLLVQLISSHNAARRIFRFFLTLTCFSREIMNLISPLRLGAVRESQKTIHNQQKISKFLRIFIVVVCRWRKLGKTDEKSTAGAFSLTFHNSSTLFFLPLISSIVHNHYEKLLQKAYHSRNNEDLTPLMKKRQKSGGASGW